MTTTHDRLLSAARTIFAQKGLAALSVRNVAAAAGLSPMAMYRHFANKDALIDALMQDGLAAWEEIVRGITAGSAMRWLERLMEAFLEFALRDPHRFDAAFLLPSKKARKYPHDFAASRSPAIAMAVARIEEAQARGQLLPLPPLRIALTMSALGQGLVSMQRARRFSGDAEFRALYRETVRQTMATLAAPRNRK